MNLFFMKTVFFSMVTALAVAGLPLVGVSAAAKYDPPVPLQGQIAPEKLEKIWAHQLRAYQRLGRTDELIKKAQQWIDRAAANGRDVSAVQVALDAFKAQATEARPIYETMKGIIHSHAGFDSDGKVTDPLKAQETVKAMNAKLQEIKSVMDGTGRALHKAIKDFREANPRPEPAATP